MESKAKDQLIRISFKDGKIKADFNNKSDGRGAYVCKDLECFDKAQKKRAFNRAFKTAIDQDSITETGIEIRDYLDKEDV